MEGAGGMAERGGRYVEGNWNRPPTNYGLKVALHSYMSPVRVCVCVCVMQRCCRCVWYTGPVIIIIIIIIISCWCSCIGAGSCVEMALHGRCAAHYGGRLHSHSTAGIHRSSRLHLEIAGHSLTTSCICICMTMHMHMHDNANWTGASKRNAPFKLILMLAVHSLGLLF